MKAMTKTVTIQIPMMAQINDETMIACLDRSFFPLASSSWQMAEEIISVKIKMVPIFILSGKVFRF